MSAVGRVFRFGQAMAEISASSSNLVLIKPSRLKEKTSFIKYYLQLTDFTELFPQFEELISLNKDLSNFNKFEEYIQLVSDNLKTIDIRLYHYVFVSWGIIFLFISSRNTNKLEKDIRIRQTCFSAYRHVLENSRQIGFLVPKYNELEFINIRPKVLRKSTKCWMKTLTGLVNKRDSFLEFGILYMFTNLFKNNFPMKVFRKIWNFFMK